MTYHLTKVMYTKYATLILNPSGNISFFLIRHQPEQERNAKHVLTPQFLRNRIHQGTAQHDPEWFATVRIKDFSLGKTECDGNYFLVAVMMAQVSLARFTLTQAA